MGHPAVAPFTRFGRCALIRPVATLARMDEHAEATYYEIHVRGMLSDTLLMAFPGFQPRAQRGDTILVGALPDQAALHGTLEQIEALGLELLEIRRQLR